MEKINEIELPKGVNRIAVKQHDDRIVIEFIPERRKFKRGDILISIVTPGLTVIFDKMASTTTFNSIYHNGESSNHGWSLKSFRHATEEEKQEFFDELKAEGKRWNAEKLIVEDTPQPKFKVGDEVRIKKEISRATHCGVFPGFVREMDDYIGQKLVINNVLWHTKGVYLYSVDKNLYSFLEDWLEPYAEEPKKGDWAIFWDNGYQRPLIRIYNTKTHSGSSHLDNHGTVWDNAVKWDGTKEQFEKILHGEI